MARPNKIKVVKKGAKPAPKAASKPAPKPRIKSAKPAPAPAAPKPVLKSTPSKPAPKVDDTPKAKPAKRAAGGPRVTVDQCISALAMIEAPARMERLGELNPSTNVLRSTYKEVKATGGALADALCKTLETYARQRGDLLEGQRGRQPPKAGDVRVYRIQKLNSGSPFIRLGMSPIGGKKGDLAKVTFGASKVSVALLDAVEAAEVVVEDDVVEDDELLETGEDSLEGEGEGEGEGEPSGGEDPAFDEGGEPEEGEDEVSDADEEEAVVDAAAE